MAEGLGTATTFLNRRLVGELTMSHRFAVTFLHDRVLPNPLDLRFQKVSGIGASVATTTIQEGGQNTSQHLYADRVTFPTVRLERGVVVGSPLNLVLTSALSTLTLVRSLVFVTPMDEAGHPLMAWMLVDAVPVSWQVGPLDAALEEVLVETIELGYSSLQRVEL